MSVYSSLKCCNKQDLDVAIDCINQNKLRICCLNCDKEVIINITKSQYNCIKGFSL